MNQYRLIKESNKLNFGINRNRSVKKESIFIKGSVGY